MEQDAAGSRGPRESPADPVDPKCHGGHTLWISPLPPGSATSDFLTCGKCFLLSPGILYGV